MQGAQIQNVASGDITRCCDILYLPNMYEHISCKVTKAKLHYHNLQTAKLSLSFILTKGFASSPDELLEKEPWKKSFFPFNAESLFPLVGVALPPRGLFALGEGEIIFSGSSSCEVTPTQWIISSPNQRPVFPSDNRHTDVNYAFIRNVMFYGELHFGINYSLDVTVLNSISPIDMAKNLAEFQIGIVLPFGNVEFITPEISLPIDSSLDSTSFSIRAAATNNCYPGEDVCAGGMSPPPIRGNENVIFGKEILFDDMSEAMCPFIQHWKHTIHYEKKIIASVVCHDHSVNARILPVLSNIVGGIAYPVHVNLISFEDKAVSLCVKITNQSTQKSSSKVVNLRASSEETVSMAMPGLETAPHGITSLLIEVSNGNERVHIEDIELHLLPHDYLPLQIHDAGRDWYRDTVFTIAGWVTPTSKVIDSWVSDAKKYIVGEVLAGGTQRLGIPQVEALWKSLEQIGVSYVDRSYAMDTSSTKTYQRVLPPSKTINLSSGNCIDLTVLFASALEQLSLSPKIILEPGHAYVGWHSRHDGENYLETTFLGSGNFSDALLHGNQSFQKNRGSFDHSIGFRVIDVEQIRKQGIAPIFND
jgi:hypothetical protein